MLKVKVTGINGEPVSYDEIVTLYASDLLYNPYHRKAVVKYDGVVEVTVPDEPVMLHAKLKIPGFGYMWVIADNMGQGYRHGAEIDFIKDAAACRIRETELVIGKGGFTPPPRCVSLLNDARTMFRLAETKPEKAAEYNMISLTSALWAGELAVVYRARAIIASREKRKFFFGCGGFQFPFPDDPEKTAMYESVFNYATLPFYLGRLEQEKDKPDYTNLDRLQDAFEKSGIETKGHPLWWNHTAGMPPWTHDLSWNDGSMAREINRVIKRSVKRYKGRIKYYDAINEAHDWCNAYKMSQAELVENTKLCCDAMHEEDPDVNAVINTCFMFGENVADEKVQWGLINERNMTPYSYFQKVEALGIKYETVGIQLYCPSRDMLEIVKMYDRFSVFGKPLHLTELGVPSHYQDLRYDSSPGEKYCLRFMYSGLWHEGEWSERLQADWLEWFYTISYAHQSVEALTWWNFSDPGYVPGSGMYHRNGKPKEIVHRLRALQEEWGFKLGTGK